MSRKNNAHFKIDYFFFFLLFFSFKFINIKRNLKHHFFSYVISLDMNFSSKINFITEINILKKLY